MGVCPELVCPNKAEDVVDPDMHGIGVVIAFVVTAALSLLIAIAAIVRGGIPDYYYMWLDEKLLSVLPKCLVKSPRQTPDNLGYQTFLLSLSDQILLTGICYGIAMYAQICSLSVLSFKVGFRLVSISSTVHIATLAVLKAHFLEHRHQALARCGFMVLFLALLFVSAFQEAYTWGYHLDASFACAHEEQLSGDTVADQVAFVLSISMSYLVAILSIKPPKDKYEPRFLTTTTLELIFSRTTKTADVEGYLRQKRRKASLADHSKANTLRQSPGFFKAVFIIIIAFLGELLDSILFELIPATFWFASNIYALCELLFASGVDTKEILSFSFGQIMPVLLLLVFAVTALEVGSIKHHHNAAAIASSKDGTIHRHNTDSEASMAQGEAAIQPSNSARRASITTNDDGSPAPSLRPESNSSTLDIASIAEPRTSTNSLSGLLETPNRNNTLEMEGGVHSSGSTLGHPAHVIDVGLEHAPKATWVGIGVAISLFAGTLVLFYFFFTYATFALVALIIILFFGELALDVGRVRQRSIERQRNRDKANTHPMEDLPAQDVPAQGDSQGTGVDLGQPPIPRRTF